VTLTDAAPSLLWAAVFVLVYVVFLAGVHSDARRRLQRFVQRRRALERVESWYPEERLVPVGLVAARSRLAAERRALERDGILRPTYGRASAPAKTRVAG
jgi:hypothetical protein